MKNDLCLSVAFMNYNYDKTSGFHPRLEKVSKLVFYAKSTSAVISGRYLG